MSQGVNRVFLVGNLGQDPEVRYTQSGTAVCNLRVAVGERRKEGDAWVDHTEWMTVVCFGKTAENVGQYLAKGRQVHVEGRLRTREYEDRDGNQRKATEVLASSVLFLGGGDSEGGGQRGGQPPREKKRDDDRGGRRDAPKGGGRGVDSYRADKNDPAFYDDDLPFVALAWGVEP